MSIALYLGCRLTSLRADYAGPVVISKLLVFYRGMSIVRSSSAWDLQQINDFLHAAVIPIRLACSDKEGVPLICSLWYLYADNALWCATQQSASVATLLERTPKCAFEVAPESMPYRGVRGQGRVTVMPDEGAATLQQLIAREQARGIAANKIVVAGFSQGGAIALHAGLRSKQVLGGVMALSTYLPIKSAFDEVTKSDVPVLMAHGSLDPILPMALGRESADLLIANDFNVEWHDYQMAHSVCAEEIDDIRTWLLSIYAAE
jgi:dienelactone hydrolase